MAVEVKDKFVTVEGLSTVYDSIEASIGDKMSLYQESGLPSVANWCSIAYGDGKFVAAAPGKIAYSADGLEWTEVTLSTSFASPKVKYVGSYFIICSGGTDIYYSSDAVTWTKTTVSCGSLDVFYTSSAYYFVGAALKVAKTTDFSTWESCNDTPMGTHYVAIFGNGRIVALADNVARYSDDFGATWTVRSLPVSGVWKDIAYGATNAGYTFFAIRSDGTVICSINGGVTWSAMSSSMTIYFVFYHSSSRYFVACDSKSGTLIGYTVSSSGGINSVRMTGGELSGKNWYGIAYGGGRYVMPAYGSDAFAYSSNFSSWTLCQNISNLEQSGEDITEAVSETLGIPDIVSDVTSLQTRVTPINKGGTAATTAAAALVNLGLTATADELNYMDGVTSSVQEQLDGKLPLTGGTMSGSIDMGENMLENAHYVKAKSIHVCDPEGTKGAYFEFVDNENITEDDPVGNAVLELHGEYWDEKVALRWIADPTYDYDAVNKKYVDDISNGKSDVGHTHSYAAASTPGGIALKSVADKNGLEIDRCYPTLIASGTIIPSGADINTIEYIKVGNYYSGSTNIVNAPESVNFSMHVSAVTDPDIPDSDNELYENYINRVREIVTEYGDRYTQSVSYMYLTSTGEALISFGEWSKTYTSKDIKLSELAFLSGIVEDAEYPGCYYRMVGEEKEWVNPPMLSGLTYRTTERCNGKPVYIQSTTIEVSYQNKDAGEVSYYLDNSPSSLVDINAVVKDVDRDLILRMPRNTLNERVEVYTNTRGVKLCYPADAIGYGGNVYTITVKYTIV